MLEGNLAAVLRRQAERLGPCPAVRYRRHGLYREMTWADYGAEALACAAALVEAGIRPGDRVGLLSENRVEWMIADLGILTAAAVNVPPHAPLTARQIHFQLHDAGVRFLFVSTPAQLEKVLPLLPELPAIQGIVAFDPHLLAPSPSHPIISWQGFLQRGRRALAGSAAELARRETALGPDDLATIMYTSGTTGNPKGVMLTHGNLLSNVRAVLEAEAMDEDEVQLNWLPFSHIYARTLDLYTPMTAGSLLALAESAETVIDDIKEVRPTHMHSVPRLYEKVLTSCVSGDPQETARKLRKVFGPRIRWLCCGGAPLPVPVAEAYHAAGLLLLLGYGLTESSPVISFNRRKQFRIGTVGPPLPGVEVKIAADGEVLSRGPHIMPGYWNNPSATADAIQDGWLHTGDLGAIDADGYLSITGRKKELLVLSNGKKVVPNHIEGLLLAEPCIDQAVICGEGRNYLTALIVPHWDNVRNVLATNGEAEALSRDPGVGKLLRQRIDAALVDVAAWEQVKKFVVLPRPFSVADGELTVSLKLRRGTVVERYHGEIDSLYRE